MTLKKKITKGDVTPTSKYRCTMPFFVSKPHPNCLTFMAVSYDSNSFWFCKVTVKDINSNSLFLSTMFKTWSLRFDDQNSNPLRWYNWHMWGVQEAVITHNRPTVLFESKAKPGLGVSSQHKLLLWDPGDQPYWKTLVNYSSDKCSRTPMHEATEMYTKGFWAALEELSPG